MRCFGCGALGHYRHKCPARGKGGPAEAPGKVKGSKGRVANLANKGPVAEEPIEEEDGVKVALQKVTATMRSVSSKARGNGLGLGPVPMAEVELEGEPVQALLDTGSPATIVSLEFLLKASAKKKPLSQSPDAWRKEMGRRLEPTPLALRNYGGGQLPVVRQVRTTICRPGHELEAVVQVQKDTPAKLLIGTDLLLKLGFLFVRTEVEDDDVDLLEEAEPAAEQEDQTPAVQGETLEGTTGTVCLLQAVRLPAQHAKLVRVGVQGLEGHSLAYFEPNHRGILMADAAVEPDAKGCVVVLLENYGCEPVEVEKGQVIGELHRANWCQVEEDPQEEGKLVAAVTNGDFSEERLERLRDSLNIDANCLSKEEAQQLETFADVFAMDSGELGSTELVTHTIDTGESPPIKQPARRVPFALHQAVDEMVEKMLSQGVVEPSHSPWSSPVVIVEKKDGSRRFCVDYRQLNSVTKMDVFPLPRIDDTLDSLAQSRYFTALDLASGYWQVRMHPASQEKTALPLASMNLE